jgi:hypothetical protein
MKSPYVRTRIAAAVGGAALIAMASFVSSCSKSENQAPSTPTTSTPATSTTPSSSVPATPTEKVLSPSDPNKFSPTVMAPPAPTESGGNHHHGLNGTS